MMLYNFSVASLSVCCFIFIVISVTVTCEKLQAIYVKWYKQLVLNVHSYRDYKLRRLVHVLVIESVLCIAGLLLTYNQQVVHELVIELALSKVTINL